MSFAVHWNPAGAKLTNLRLYHPVSR